MIAFQWMPRWVLLGVMCVAASAPACTLLIDTGSLDDGVTSGCDGRCDAASGGDDGDSTVDSTRDGADGTTDGTPSNEAGSADGCVSSGGPRPVGFVGLDEAGNHRAYCIDSTEVTMGQYAVFLNDIASGYSGVQPASCAFNTSFAPISSDNGCSATTFDPQGKPDYPMACVNWCDAFAFCQWSGKRLCQTVGGGAMKFDRTANPDDEWFAACSDNGANEFPWGASFDMGSSCNTICREAGAALPVASLDACAVDGVFDQGGNVSEWVDSCLGDASGADCVVEGDSFQSQNGPFCAACNSETSNPRSYASVDVGFRCCGNGL